ncbi:hypothetical protein [Pseudomonas lopnurensis]|uniref:hypothetical protein n=1 Tax=Pseudomonas lopnurensis TaxID=1477517 RepID=UPI00187AFE10|nr:hypothetical protein [Pseudomonas lopnurensis]MBE7373022.1 hypothetical protein [Pseudomonas lopnurensis]
MLQLCALDLYKFCYARYVNSIALGFKESTGLEVFQDKPDFSGVIVHIVMPGASSLRYLDRINKGEVVLGFNLSALLPIRLDAIFIENCNGDEYSQLQFEACALHAKKNNTQTLMKNIWTKGRYSVDFMRKYTSFGGLLIDVPLRPQQFSTQKTLDLWVTHRKYSFSSFLSSLVFALNYVYSCNGRLVVLHGVDFGGKYFWEETDNLILKDSRIENFKSKSVHDTQAGKIPFSSRAEHIFSALGRAGLEVKMSNSFYGY